MSSQFRLGGEKCLRHGDLQLDGDLLVVLVVGSEIEGGEGRNRTVDTTIFSRMLYQLSYLATEGMRSLQMTLNHSMRPPSDCVERQRHRMAPVDVGHAEFVGDGSRDEHGTSPGM